MAGEETEAMKRVGSLMVKEKKNVITTKKECNKTKESFCFKTERILQYKRTRKRKQARDYP